MVDFVIGFAACAVAFFIGYFHGRHTGWRRGAEAQKDRDVYLATRCRGTKYDAADVILEGGFQTRMIVMPDAVSHDYKPQMR